MAAKMLWSFGLCSLVGDYQRSSETLVTIHKTTGHYNIADHKCHFLIKANKCPYSPRIPQASELNPERSSSREPLPEEASEL
jgi:hypothetical protein